MFACQIGSVCAGSRSGRLQLLGMLQWRANRALSASSVSVEEYSNSAKRCIQNDARTPARRGDRSSSCLHTDVLLITGPWPCVHDHVRRCYHHMMGGVRLRNRRRTYLCPCALILYHVQCTFVLALEPGKCGHTPCFLVSINFHTEFCTAKRVHTSLARESPGCWLEQHGRCS